MTTDNPAEVVPVLDRSDADWDDLDHYFCSCTPDLGHCGADLTGVEELPDEVDMQHPCVVCVDLCNLPCLRCGCGMEPECAACIAYMGSHA